MPSETALFESASHIIFSTLIGVIGYKVRHCRQIFKATSQTPISVPPVANYGKYTLLIAATHFVVHFYSGEFFIKA